MMSLRFGIRGKIALLVVVAAAISAYLVAGLLSNSAEELVRSHELVDLGDEAQLRGWELVDKVDGLREDTFSLGFSAKLRGAVSRGGDVEELKQLARAACHRYWAQYLRIDLIEWDPGAQKPTSRPIVDKASLADPSAVWTPSLETFSAEGRQRVIEISEIQRVLIRREIPETGQVIEQWEPVIWASAPLSRSAPEDVTPPPVIRVLMILSDPESPRHLMALIGPDGQMLLRPDESDYEEGRVNEAIFQEFVEDAEVQEGLAEPVDPALVADSEMSELDDPQVERLKLFEYIPLKSHYWFLEGVPSESLHLAFEEDDEEAQDEFLDQLRIDCRNQGRIGGLRGGVKELRLLSPSKERLEELREKVGTALTQRFGESVTRFHWRQPVPCDEIHAWAIRLGMGTVDQKSDYLLIYAVLDDELASSIHQEMASLRLYAFLIAAVAGAIAFMVSLFFVKPLQRMTLTAQRVSEADTERLPAQLRRLVDHLPVRRRDEVGDIARASKRLFEEVIESQEMLENRVHERTAKLAQANLDLEEANEQLTSLSREKDAFVAKVSHDLRQPLNAIFLQVEALKLSELDPLQAEDVAKIHDHAARELNLVNDILEYQKIIMGAETLNRDGIDIARLLQDLSDAHAPVVRAKNLAYVSECAENAGIFEADRHRIRQILDNLVSNAGKFTQEGTVTVGARVREVGGEEWIEFSVADTGRGMQPGEQAKAFVPFVSNKKGNEGGTGLGLSICRELAQQMGGKIGFISEPGQGTTFTVLFPRKADPSRYRSSEESEADYQAEARPDYPEDVPVSLGDETGEKTELAPGATVLVIDDDEAVRALMKRSLEGEGYSVHTAENGEDGLERARELLPDAVTLDIVMPEIDGWEVLAKLKSDPRTEAIPVIMVSVMADRSESLALGVEDCLVKPVDLNRLARVVRRVTDQAKNRTILVVDDDRSSREALVRLLAHEGWEPAEAESGKDALGKMSETVPSAIVLDLVMPGMDGFEFLLELARHPEWNRIPIMVVTGASPSTDEAEFLQRRVKEVIAKGETSAKEVIECLRSQIG